VATLYNVKTLQPEEVPEDQVLSALQSGEFAFKKSEPVYLNDPDGNPVSVDPSEAEKALSEGFTFQNPIERAGRKAAEKLGPASAFATQVVNQALFGIPQIVENKDPFLRAKNEALAKQNPVANVLGGLTGFGASLFVGGPLFKAGAKAGQAAEQTVLKALGKSIAAKTAGEVSEQAATSAAKEIVKNLVGSGVRLGVEGGIQMAPQAVTEAALGDYEAAGESLLFGVGFGSLLGAGGALAKDVTKLGTRIALDSLPGSSSDFVRALGKKGANVLTGTPEEAIEHFLKNPERVKAAKNLDEIVGAFGEKIDEITSGISTGSGEGYRILQKSEKFFDSQKIIQPVLEAAEKIQKKATFFPELEAPANIMRKLAENAASNSPGGEMSALTARELLDGVRNVGYQAKRQGLGAAGQVGSFIKSAGGQIDDILKKEIPEYAAHMSELAKRVETLKTVKENFRSERGMTNMLRRVMNGKDQISASAIRELDKEFGTNFLDDLKDAWAKAQFNKETTQGSRKSLIGAAVGSLGGGPIGTAVGAVAGGILDKYGTAITQKSVEGILIAEQAMKRAAKRLDEIPRTLKFLKRFSKPETISLNAALRYFMPARDIEKNEVKSLNKFREQMTMLAQNPISISNSIASLTSPISERGAPKVASIFNQKIMNAKDYIMRSMPMPRSMANPFAKTKDFKPSRLEMKTFAQKMQVLADPFVVLDELKSGTLTLAHMDALKNVYPRMFQAIRDRVRDVALSDPEPLPYAARVQLSLLMDEPLDASMKPDAIRRYQDSFAAFNAEEERIENQININASEGMQSDTEKILYRA
jgi:hypothetical protein